MAPVLARPRALSGLTGVLLTGALTAAALCNPSHPDRAVPVALPTGGTVIVDETFQGASVPDPSWEPLGRTCLTGAPLGSTPDPATAGLSVTFEQYQYAGTQAPGDGIGFYLVDGATPLDSQGADGGSFTVTVADHGPAAATGVTVTDLLPSGLVLVRATPSAGGYDRTTGVWTVGSLAAGAQATLTLTARAIRVGPVTNTATLTAVDQTDTDPVNNRATVQVVVGDRLPTPTPTPDPTCPPDPHPGDPGPRPGQSPRPDSGRS